MKRKILTYPNDIEILSLKSQEVTDLKDENFKQLVQDLKDTLHEDSTGVGLSAIQIGVPLRVCIINYGKEIVMINPVITWRRSGPSGIKKFREGCLSDPGKYVEVERAQKVICQYTDENGEKKEISEGGWMSAIIQHELDHFEGICKVYELTKES
mgnify:FL=1